VEVGFEVDRLRLEIAINNGHIILRFQALSILLFIAFLIGDLIN
jgi:hypothetical protein